MKTLHLSIIVVLASSLGIVGNTVFADMTNNAEIQDIKVQPSTIKVGNTFTINATLVNNYPIPIFLASGVCQAPFSVIFDNHVTVKQNKIMCKSSNISVCPKI